MTNALLSLTQRTCSMYEMLEKKPISAHDTDELIGQLVEFGNEVISNKVAGEQNEFKSEFTLLTLKIINILSLDSIQHSDNLKYQLSKAARIFVEITMFQNHEHKRNVYKETKDEIIRQLAQVKSTLPKTEVGTVFETECCLAAAELLGYEEGLFTNTAKNLGSSLLKGTIEAIASLSPGTLVTSLLDTLKKSCEGVGGSWYPDAWEVRWRLTNLTQKNDFDQVCKECIGSIEHIKSKGRHFSLCLTEMFLEILQNPKAEDALKTRVFEGINSEAPGLLHLADLSSSSITHLLSGWILHDKFWNTRYRVVEHLNSLSKEKAYSLKVIQKLAFRLFHEKNVHTAKLLRSIFENISEDERIVWNKCFFELGIDMNRLEKEDLELLELINKVNDKHLLLMQEIIADSMAKSAKNSSDQNDYYRPSSPSLFHFSRYTPSEPEFQVKQIPSPSLDHSPPLSSLRQNFK